MKHWIVVVVRDFRWKINNHGKEREEISIKRRGDEEKAQNRKIGIDLHR